MYGSVGISEDVRIMVCGGWCGMRRVQCWCEGSGVMCSGSIVRCSICGDEHMVWMMGVVGFGV